MYQGDDFGRSPLLPPSSPTATSHSHGSASHQDVPNGCDNLHDVLTDCPRQLPQQRAQRHDDLLAQAGVCVGAGGAAQQLHKGREVVGQVGQEEDLKSLLGGGGWGGAWYHGGDVLLWPCSDSL